VIGIVGVVGPLDCNFDLGRRYQQRRKSFVHQSGYRPYIATQVQLLTIQLVSRRVGIK
jgi:hypothetical protein